MFNINPNIKPIIKQVGKEKTPVIIIDDFITDLTPLLNDAYYKQSFKPDPNSLYPGIRSGLPDNYVLEILKAVYQGIYKVYEVPRNLKLKLILNYFSLINTPEKDLSLLQRMPHFDTSKPYYFAILHYLNPSMHGGTGLFRHKLTSIERIEEKQVANYIESTQKFMQINGQPDAKYHNSSSDLFELYDQVAYKQNRLVIYPGNLIHSTIVDLKRDINNNPQSGRLTSNIFIDFM
jgi:hypothetical protein